MMARAECAREGRNQDLDLDVDPDRQASWLLILENATNLESLAELIPTGDHGCIISTTRTGLIMTRSDIPKSLLTINLSPPHMDACTEILLNLLSQNLKCEDVYGSNLRESCMSLKRFIDDELSSPAVMAGIMGRSRVTGMES